MNKDAFYFDIQITGSEQIACSSLILAVHDRGRSKKSREHCGSSNVLIGLNHT